MCKFTYTFYACGHRTEDHVQGCSHYQRNGIHCDVDNPEVKRTRCEVDLQNRQGFCPRCVHLEQMQAEEAALKKDMERAKRLDAEEQERNRLAHEAHLRKVQQESFRELQSKDETLARVLKENEERAERNTSQPDRGVSGSSHAASNSKSAEKQGTAVEVDKKLKSTSSTNGSQSCPPPPPPLPPLPPTTSTHSRSSTGSQPPPPPPLPHHHTTPNLPPNTHFQPPKDQSYGRFKIGTRHQPIHPSQDLPETPTVPAEPPCPKEPSPSARLAGTVGPEVPTPINFAVPSGDQRSRLRPASSSLGRRSTSGASPPSPQEQAPNELEAAWKNRGIQREVDEDEGYTSGSSITPSQSASQRPARTPSTTVCGSSTDHEEAAEAPSITISTKSVSNIDQQRRKGWSGA